MSFSLKDQLFNADRVSYLACLLDGAVKPFNRSRFEKDCLTGLGPLELKQRIGHIATALENHLASDFRKSADQILHALPPPLDPNRTDDDFGDFIFAPLGEYVVRIGCSRTHLRQSLRVLKELTKRFSMEFSIRHFINAFPDETFAALEKWSTDSNYHVRRLVSESTRPFLPWAQRLTTDPMRPLLLLESLHSDPTRFVVRSVANHLNDIAKSKPQLIVQTLERWQSLGQQESDEIHWMTRHALRTLVKKGDSNALKLLGYRAKPRIEVKNFRQSPARIKPGESIAFSFDVIARRDEKLVIDYVIDFVRSNGSTSPKVHKLKSTQVRAGATTNFSKSHHFKANATTVKLYPGVHKLTLQINGQSFDTCNFELVLPR
jgi:3-methyladenine DNA glycosylase AlkC